MKHLKYFRKAINEDLSVSNEGIYADSWTPTENPEGDYDVTWTSESGEPVTAVFRDSGGPIVEEGEMGYSIFETVPGTSSDNADYSGEVRYKEVGGDSSETFQIVSILILKKG